MVMAMMTMLDIYTAPRNRDMARWDSDITWICT